MSGVLEALPPRCEGQGRASSAPAPEELTALVRRSPTSWMFVGASGTIYEAQTPLGAFVRTLSPPEPIAELAGGGGTLLAVTRDGGVLRWREDLGWKRASLDGAASPPPRAFHVAMAEGGRALALAVPESLFASEDGGATWARAPLPAMGLSRVGVTEGGELLAEGLLASAAWDPRRSPPFSRRSAALPDAQIELSVTAPRAPSAGAAAYGRAAMTGDRYIEAIRPDDAGAPWLLASGPIEGPLRTAPLPGTGGCGSVKLGASGRRIVAVCVEEDGDRIAARVLRSDDGGGAWSQVATLSTPDVDRVGVAVAPDGAALLTGVCKPSGGGGDCSPTAPLLLTAQGDRAEVTVAMAPTLSTPAALPAFSVDGRSAYFVGFRDKDERLALFVSHDGGETFAPRPLDRIGALSSAASGADAEAALEDEDAEDDPDERASGGFELTEESSLRPADDGAVGLLLGDSGALVYLVADDDGRVVTVGAPPVEGASLAGYGRRVVAIAPAASRSGADEVAALWESLDGGVSWAELPEMPALSRDASQGTLAITCGASGCLFGDVVTRVGWGGQAEGAPSRPRGAPARGQPAVRTPIACETSPGSAWTRIDHVDSRGLGLPSANTLLRGRSVWSVLTRAPSGAVGVVSAIQPEAGAGEARVVTRTLLPAVPRGGRVATSVTYQMEGYAAARVRLPAGGAQPGAPMRNVEIAWENWMDGTSGRGTIADAGPFEIGDVKPFPEPARRAAPPASGAGRRPALDPPAEALFDPELLSVSLGGIFVRPHSGSARSALTFFYEPPGRLQRFEYPTWPASAHGQSLEIHGDAVFAEGRPLGVGMVRQASGGAVSTILLAHRPASSGAGAGGSTAPAAGAGWQIDAVTVAPPPSRDRVVHTDWTYAGRAIGVTTLVADPARAAAWAVFRPFRGDGTLGPAQPLPTPFDLGDAPRPCSAAERAATARLEAPLFLGDGAVFPGTRHPVLVTDVGPSGAPEAMTLLTTSAVLHGTPAAPCIAGWEARALGRAPLVAIIPGDLAQAWLFRVAAGPPSPSGTSIELRPMACRFEPGAKVPEAVWNEPATVR